MFITPLFAAIFGLIYVVLSIGVVKIRLKQQVSLGTGGLDDLEKRIRIHANFAEYVPFALLLLFFLETITLSSNLAFWLGCLLLLGRICHVVGMRNGEKYLTFRKIGMLSTFAVIIVASITVLRIYLPFNI